MLRAYQEKTPRSAELARRANELFPSGVTHVGRYLQPHPIYVARACGSRKWDVDGNEYVDYFGGHGALILGHNHPAVVEAVTVQLARGTHYGACHELELEWAELLRQMIPSAERVRFTSSGTEATMLALRLARAYTGRQKVIRFAGHFHGWHDHVAFGADPAPGILPGVAEAVLLAPANDMSRVREWCETRDDVAAIILEPTGATFGMIPAPPPLLHELRELTARRGIVLIFDEVVTGFRCSPGGAQGYYGVTPDLTTLAKILAGGYPGAALVGRAELFAPLEYRGGPPAIAHQGTFNACPISAAAGIATLKLVRDTDVCARANRTAAAIRDGLNDVIRRRGLPWCAYGEFSAFHLFPRAVTPEDIYAGRVPWAHLKGTTPLAVQQEIRTGFLCEGVDLIGWPGGVVSAVHSGEDVDRTVSAWERITAAMPAGPGPAQQLLEAGSPGR
jgi:glutamate-1-semialdehyde 2,1-aminomutase